VITGRRLEGRYLSRSAKRALTAVAFIFVLLSASIPVQAGLFDDPSMSMSVSPARKQAHVDQAEGALMEFEGRFDINQGTRVTSSVTITVNVDTGWGGGVEPNRFEITGPESKDFWVTVLVPSGASADEVCHVRVTATLTSTGFDPIEKYDVVEITVERYMHMAVNSMVTTDTVDRGGTTSFHCDITNRGNGEMTFWPTAESVKGVDVTLDKDSIAIPAGETRTVTVQVTVGLDMPAGTYVIVINVVGEMSMNKQKVQDSVTFEIEVPTNYQVYRSYIISSFVLIVVLAIVVVVYKKRKGYGGE